MKQSFLSQLIARLGSSTPIFFKKILIFGVTLGGIGGAILGIDATTLPIALPPILITLSGYFVTAGIVCAAVAKTATTDPDLQAKGGSNVLVNPTKEVSVSKEANKSPEQ